MESSDLTRPRFTIDVSIEELFLLINDHLKVYNTFKDEKHRNFGGINLDECCDRHKSRAEELDEILKQVYSNI
jgi:hypothetical protein